MRKLTSLISLMLIAGTCLAQTNPLLCPKHIEVPQYSVVAWTARMTGKFDVKVSLDSEGKVSSADIENLGIDSASQILGHASIRNAKQWTFEKPPYSPYKITITYEYGFDKSLPIDRQGERQITKVLIDLPNRVSILSNQRIVVAYGSKTKSE